ncbi:transmembrane protein 190 isoform X7 [Monodelphis domestica]|uniref:transmembrane protein 190 isoform X7 n=1 Tax=Monodelphis domestica TaxID=13616 RepID=UPI0024E1EC62|nr:transmembrane protein 190 isoform X7 [Monodelphis domestica]
MERAAMAMWPEGSRLLGQGRGEASCWGYHKGRLPRDPQRSGEEEEPKLGDPGGIMVSVAIPALSLLLVVMGRAGEGVESKSSSTHGVSCMREKAVSSTLPGSLREERAGVLPQEEARGLGRRSVPRLHRGLERGIPRSCTAAIRKGSATTRGWTKKEQSPLLARGSPRQAYDDADDATVTSEDTEDTSEDQEEEERRREEEEEEEEED